MLSIKECESDSEILDLMATSFPWYESNVAVIDMLSDASTLSDLGAVRKHVQADQNVTIRVRSMVEHNLDRLQRSSFWEA